MLIIVIYFQGTYHTGIQGSIVHWEYENELQIPVYTWGLQLCTYLYCILKKKKNKGTISTKSLLLETGIYQSI